MFKACRSKRKEDSYMANTNPAYKPIVLPNIQNRKIIARQTAQGVKYYEVIGNVVFELAGNPFRHKA